MITYNAPAAATFVARKHACAIMKLEANSTVDLSSYFIQIHDSPIAVAAGTVPLKSWPAAECGYKEFKAGELCLSKGCFIAVSSTDLTYTAQASNITGLQVEFAQPDLPAGIITVTAAAVNQLNVWVTADGQHAIEQVRITTTTFTGTQYIQLWVTNDAGSSQIQLASQKLVANSINVMDFGAYGGRQLYGVVSGVAITGCRIDVRDAAWAGNLSGDTFTIYADYI